MTLNLARAPLTAVVVAFAGLGLVACGGATQQGSFVNSALLGTSSPPPPIDLERFGPKVKCPPLNIRPGTESFSVYEGEEIGTFSVRYQANITDTALECHVADDVLTVRIGVRGRLLAGPKRGEGPVSVPLPIRVAITSEGDNLVYSELYAVPTELTVTETSKAWSQVIEDIRIPVASALRIFVGFDDAARERG